MPIRPENKARYPKDWKQISLRIRERAGWRCEYVDANEYRCRAVHGEPHPFTLSRVVLTVAHPLRAAVRCIAQQKKHPHVVQANYMS